MVPASRAVIRVALAVDQVCPAALTAGNGSSAALGR